jgi:transposase
MLYAHRMERTDQREVALDLDALEARLGHAAMLALRDQLLARHPPEASHPAVRMLSNVERQAEAARIRFDAANVAPTSGPLFDAVAKGAERRDTWQRRKAAIGNQARFYAKRPRGKITWQVMDRLTLSVAYFALHGAKKPATLEGLATKQDARALIVVLEDYFNSIGLPCHSRLAASRFATPRIAVPRATALAATIISDDLWQLLKPLLPVKPAQVPGGQGRPHGPEVDDRAALAGIILALRDKLAWRAIPIEIGCSGQTCRTRLREWQSSGTWRQIHSLLLEHVPGAFHLDWTKTLQDPLIGGERRAALLSRIDRFIADVGISDRRLGVVAFNSETFIHLIRKGSSLRESTYSRIVRYLDNAEPVQSSSRTHIAQPSSGPHALVSNDERKALLSRIERYLAATNTLPSNFGLAAFKNSGFVRHLRMARGVTERVRDKVDEYIDSMPIPTTFIESHNDNQSTYSDIARFTRQL